MTRVRVSTTVDAELIATAREVHGGGTDASVIEAALRALLAAHHRAEIDAAYDIAWAAMPVDTPDEWGDLASFGAAVRRASR